MDNVVAKHSQHTWKRLEKDREKERENGKLKLKDIIIGDPLPLGYVPQKKRYVDVGEPLPLDTVRTKPRVRERVDFGAPLPLPYLPQPLKEEKEVKKEIKQEGIQKVVGEVKVEDVVENKKKDPLAVLLEVVEQLESLTFEDDAQAKLKEAVNRLQRLVPHEQVEVKKEKEEEEEQKKEIKIVCEVEEKHIRGVREICVCATVICLVWLSYILAD